MTRQNDVAVQNGAHGVANRLGEIVALDQHREEAGDRAAAEIAGALEDPGQEVEHRWRVAFLAGGLARRQADFALRHGQTGDRVHDQQYAGPLVAKILGHGQRHEAGAYAQRRRPVRGGHHHHGPLHAFRSQFVVQKRPHFAVALAHQGNDTDVGEVVARHGPQQGALAYAAAAEDAHPLPFADGQQAVDDPDSGDQRIDDVLPLQRVGRRLVQLVGMLGVDVRASVHGPPEAVQHPAQ